MTKTNTTSPTLSWAKINALCASSYKTPKGKPDKQEGLKLAAYADAFGIPFWGFNILQGKPYINTLGLEWIHARHPEALRFEESELVRVYDTPGENQIALVAVTGVVRGGGKVTAYGSVMSTNVGMVKGYPNELAETRAKNRLLRRVLLPYMYEDFYNNLQTMGRKAVELLKGANISEVASVSAEEMSNEKEEVDEKPVILTQEETKGIADYMTEFNKVKKMEDLTVLSTKIRDDKDLNNKQKARLRQIYVNTVNTKELL